MVPHDVSPSSPIITHHRFIPSVTEKKELVFLFPYSFRCFIKFEFSFFCFYLIHCRLLFSLTAQLLYQVELLLLLKYN